MTPFYGWGSTASRLAPLQGGGLLFTTKFPEIPGTPSSLKFLVLSLSTSKKSEIQTIKYGIPQDS